MVKRKRYFQLVEVLIALFLVASCIVPILSSSVTMYREQKRLTEQAELDHWAHVAHAKLIESLYLQGAKGASLRELVEKPHELEDFSETPYTFKYELRVVNNRKFKENVDKILLELDLFAHKKERQTVQHVYKYYVYVKRTFKEGQKEVFKKRRRRKDR